MLWSKEAEDLYNNPNEYGSHGDTILTIKQVVDQKATQAISEGKNVETLASERGIDLYTVDGHLTPLLFSFKLSANQAFRESKKAAIDYGLEQVLFFLGGAAAERIAANLPEGWALVKKGAGYALQRIRGGTMTAEEAAAVTGVVANLEKSGVVIAQNSNLVNGATHLIASNGDDVALQVTNGLAQVEVQYMEGLNHPELLRAVVAEAKAQGATKLVLNSGPLVTGSSRALMDDIVSSGKTFLGQSFEKLADGTYQIDLTSLLKR